MNGSISDPPSIVCSRDVNPDLMLRTIKEAADQLSVSRRTVEREIASGRIVITAVRGSVRIDQKDLEAYIAAGKRSAEGA